MRVASCTGVDEMGNSAAVGSTDAGAEICWQTERAQGRRDSCTGGVRRLECLSYQDGGRGHTLRARRDVWAEVFAEARRRVPLPEWPAPEPMPKLGALVVLVTTARPPMAFFD